MGAGSAGYEFAYRKPLGMGFSALVASSRGAAKGPSEAFLVESCYLSSKALLGERGVSCRERGVACQEKRFSPVGMLARGPRNICRLTFAVAVRCTPWCHLWLVRGLRCWRWLGREGACGRGAQEPR